MAGWVQSVRQALLDYKHPTTGGTDYVGYSENGTSESANLARTAVGATNWASATAADPSVKANTASILSAAASGSGTITHFAIMNSGGTLITGWTALSSSRAVVSGDKLEWAAGQLQVTLAG